MIRCRSHFFFFFLFLWWLGGKRGNVWLLPFELINKSKVIYEFVEDENEYEYHFKNFILVRFKKILNYVYV